MTDVARAARMELANLLAMQVDSARRMPPVERPLVNWAQGDAIATLLNELSALLADEPLGELAGELAENLRAKLGPIPWN